MIDHPTTLSILRDLIGFPTVSRDPNRDLIDYCASYLKSIGASVDIITAEAGRKANLYATIGPQDVPGVMLSGHTDVVPVDGQAWSKPPFEAVVDDGRVYGRGTADMKGFVASALYCASKAAERQLETPLHLALSHDEEIGCVGVHSLIDMLADAPVKPAMCIVGEPTSMSIATGHKGKTAIEANCIGSAAHSAQAPQAVNAIHMACDLISQIRHLQDDIAVNGVQDTAYDIPYTTLHAGLTGSNQRIKVAFGIEGGLFSQKLGISAVVCGPGSMAQGHKADEFVTVEQLAACDAMLAALIERLEKGVG